MRATQAAAWHCLRVPYAGHFIVPKPAWQTSTRFAGVRTPKRVAARVPSVRVAVFVGARERAVPWGQDARDGKYLYNGKWI